MSWTPATGRSSRAADASSADCARNNSDAWQATAADIAAARADNRDAARETSLSGIEELAASLTDRPTIIVEYLVSDPLAA